MKSSTDFFLSCDWGTTSFRLKLVDLNNGDVKEALEIPHGIKKVSDLWTESDKKQKRTSFYYQYLQENISLLAKKANVSLDGIPIVISGMASSNIGIKELPYAPLPISLKSPKLHLDIKEGTVDFPHKVMLISGIRTGDDVMRGEETQLLGLSANHNIENGICILTGTHSKHVFIEDNTVVRFKTYLTGELFDLLSTKSILKHSVLPEKTVHTEAFQQGIQQSQQENMIDALFKIRAKDVIYNTDPKENYYFLSGFLIGTELMGLKNFPSAQIFLSGEKLLQQLYVEALSFLGINRLSVKNADDLTIEGHRFILNTHKL